MLLFDNPEMSFFLLKSGIIFENLAFIFDYLLLFKMFDFCFYKFYVVNIISGFRYKCSKIVHKVPRERCSFRAHQWHCQENILGGVLHLKCSQYFKSEQNKHHF